MIVELVGLPGSGKSTFARALEKEGIWIRARIDGRWELLYYGVFFILRHPLSTVFQLIWLVRYRGNSALWYTKFINLFLVHNAKFMKASLAPSAIIDQGHLQNAMSLFDEPVEREVILRYLTAFPRPDVSVFFDIDADERARRQQERGYEPREALSLSSRETWKIASEKHFGTLLEERDTFAWTSFVLTIGGQEDLMRLLQNLRIWRFVMHMRMPTEKAHGLQIAKTLEALAKNGEHVELWVPKRENSIRDDVFAYYSLTERFPVCTLSSFEALQFVKSLGSWAYWFDATAFLVTLLMERIDTESIYYTRSAPVAWLLKEKGAKRVYFEAHLWPSSKERAFRYLLAGVDQVIANSEGTNRAFQIRGFTNTLVVRNGADLEKFDNSLTHMEARNKVQLPLAGNIIMYVGSFARWKGVATLYAAWTKIQKLFPDSTLLLVGGETKTLEQFKECEGIALDNTTLVLPHLPTSFVPTYLRAANILVLPNEGISEESIHYTSPIKLFEYMASGRPIVVSDLPSMCEVLDETTATFFTSADSDDLAEKLSFVLTHAGEVEKQARNASHKVADFSWEKRAQRLCALVP